jgi:hypothetical protein
MMERERLLGLRTEERPDGLIFPVVFFDGEHFPQEALQVQYRDLSKWNTPHPVFRDTADYVEFDKQVQLLVNELAVMIRRAPEWQDWPVVTPDAPGADERVVKLPRL